MWGDSVMNKLSRLPKVLVAGIVLAVLAASPALPQASSKNEDIRALLELTNTAALMDQMIAPLLMPLEGIVRATYPRLPDDAVDIFMDEARSAVLEAQPDLEELIVEIYDNEFEHAEIISLLAFYRTPLGARLLESLPRITQASLEAGQGWGEAIGRRLGPRAVTRLRRRGYEIEDYR